MRQGRRSLGAGIAGLILALAAGIGSAWAADAVAVLTEIRPGKGEVRVKLGGENEWKAPAPLLSLRPGDQVRVTQDAHAVIVFTGGRGPQTVQTGSSPFTVQAPSAAGGGEKAQALMSSVTAFLLGKQEKPAYVSAYVPLSTRSVRQPPPVLLSPRETRLLGTPVVFEWTGSESQKYGVRVFGPDGMLLWEQTGLPRKDVTYPPSAPALKPGVRYAWELHAERHPVQRGEFELMPAADVTRVKQSLAQLQPAGSGQASSTTALFRAGYLAQEGLYQDARRELLTAIAADPSEASLHQLLGHVYDRMGVKDLATDSFDEARFLSAPRP